MFPLVSFIIPFYNSEKFIAETLKSIFNQTIKDFEIILVDDGSTDSSVEIIRTFKDERIKLFQQINSGPSAASNYGIKQAKGKYIKFLDSDDIINPVHIEKMLFSIENSPNSIASCSWGTFRDSDYNNAKFIPESTWVSCNSKDWLFKALQQRSDMTPLWLWLIPESILKRAGFYNESLTLTNDFEFSVRVLLASEYVVFVEEAIVYYRIGIAKSVSVSVSEKSVLSAFNSTMLAYEFIKSTSALTDISPLFANRLMLWVYRFYPLYPNLLKKYYKAIHELGGSNIRFEGSNKIMLVAKVFGWKTAKQLQNIYYKIKYD